MNFSDQVHDFNAGIAPSGLFWTVPVGRDDVRTHLSHGAAEMKVSNIAVIDSGNIPNSLMHGPTVPATVSFDVRWFDGWQLTPVRNVEQKFAGEYMPTHATISWSASREGFRFDSDPRDTSTGYIARLGAEGNGVYFK